MEPGEHAILKARRRDDDAQHTASLTRNTLKTAVADACTHGMTEQRAADLAGVTRLTIRDWLGKGRK
jgi:hypothetical protein